MPATVRTRLRLPWTFSLATVVATAAVPTMARATQSPDSRHSADPRQVLRVAAESFPSAPTQPPDGRPSADLDPRLTQAVDPAQHQQYLFTTAFRDPTDEALGATLEPVGESLRVQLGLPKGEGLVVASLAGDGPAAQSGLAERDILLTLSGKALGKSEDVQARLKEAGDQVVPLEILRGGKRTTLSVQPVYRVTLGPVNQEKVDYFIGVPVGPVDPTLRSHLDIPADVGLVVNDVAPDSPAEKAGVKKNDILVKLRGKPLTNTETLVAQIQATKDATTELELIRGGKTLSVQITPVKRVTKVPPHHAATAFRMWSTVPGYHGGRFGDGVHESYEPHKVPPATWTWSVDPARAKPTEVAPVSKRLDALDAELKALRKSVEELRDALKKPRD